MNVLVAGAGGALGGHLVKKLLQDGHTVRAVDIKPMSEWWQLHPTAKSLVLDLSTIGGCSVAVTGQERVFNLACDMGGMGFISTHRADCMLSVLINTHLLRAADKANVDRYFFASSACVYPAYRQDTPGKGYGLLKEKDAYPAEPEAGYGWEKLFSELMCHYAGEDWGLPVRIARIHNVYGPHSTWTGGREKAPAAICRKVAEAKLTGADSIEVWGDGSATRSFLYVDDFVEGALHIMDSDYGQPINLGSDEVVSVSQLVTLIESIAGTSLRRVYNTAAPVGVAGRGSDNTLAHQVLGWGPDTRLHEGLTKLYAWVEDQVSRSLQAAQ